MARDGSRLHSSTKILRATRVVPLWTPGPGDLAVPAVFFPQQLGRFVLAGIKARRIAIITHASVPTSRVEAECFFGETINANYRARR